METVMEQTLMEQTLTEESSLTTQYLTFNLGGKLFALVVSKTYEVLELTNITKVPKTPAFMRGVINLRGRVVPVIDMRLKFGMPEGQETVDTCIVVMELSLGGEATVLGALVDSVDEVIDLDPNKIEPAPKIGTHLDTEFILGMGKLDEQFVIILDIDRIFSREELSVVQAAGGEKEEEEE